MSGCMATDKPLVSIVMAVYEPNMDWLREQLESLNAQTYPNLELIVCDDYSQHVEFSAIQSCVRDCISAFPYTIERNEKNLGSNQTFERLTLMAKGEYIAYCDQDDVWLKEKVETLVPLFNETTVNLVCSDMYIIDGEGRQKADSITQVRRHHIFRSGGASLAEKLLFSNFVTGCTMLVRSEIAKASIPFCPYMLHDHYLAFYTALHGEIRSTVTPLIRYRIHGGNQTGVMAGIIDKQSYLKIRIHEPILRLYWLRERFWGFPQIRILVSEGIQWLEARRDNMNKVYGSKKIVWKYRKFGQLTALFELVAPQLPEFAFMVPIRMQVKKL